jgi:hypothetical protein
MNINEVYSGSYLKADDLQGKRVTVRINHVSVKEFEGDKGMDKKIILGFEGKDKCLVCNKTNAAIIAEVLGSQNTDDWIGGTIKLEVRKVEFSGRLVPAIRVVLEDRNAPATNVTPFKPEPPRAAPAAAPATEQESDDVPF